MKKYGRFTEDQVKEKISELPIWAREYFEENQVKIAELERVVEEFTIKQKSSDMSWQYLMDIEHFIPKNSHVKFYHDPPEFNYRAYVNVYFRNIGKEKVLEIQGTHNIFIEPRATNNVYVRMEGNQEIYGKKKEEQRDKDMS